MPDLETALRAKLDEIEKKAAKDSGESESGSPMSNLMAGMFLVVNDLRDWLDSRPDGWHSLEESPDDLPIRNIFVDVIVEVQLLGISGAHGTDFISVIGMIADHGHWYFPTLERWEDVIAWQERVTIPARFKSKEKV